MFLEQSNHCSTVGPSLNNLVEGFHSKLNKYLKAPHPHIFKLINVFKRYEVTSNVHYLSILSSSGPQSSSKSANKDKRINNLTEKVSNTAIDLETLLNQSAPLMGNQKN